MDLYIYRISELKAIKIGKVTRLLKQTSVDCIINHDQTALIPKNFNEIEENRNIQQILSDGYWDFVSPSIICKPSFSF